MAKAILPTNFTDDVLNESMDGKRRYNMIPNADGSQSLEDVTAYDQLGSNFGASNINAMNQAINESFDKNKMISDMDELDAVTQSGYGVDALLVKEVNERLMNLINILYPLGIPLVPKMTSNTTPSGEASASSYWSEPDYPAWEAFNGTNNDGDDCWISSANTTSGYLCYKFENPTKVTVFELTNRNHNESINAPKNISLLASNNGTNWNNLGSFVNNNGKNKTTTFNVDNNSEYLYYKININSVYDSGNAIAIGKLQFYNSIN